MIDISLRKSLGAFQLDVDLQSDSDGIIALFGRSGSGKTSLVNCLAGLIRPDSGHIRINGQELFCAEKGINLPPEKRRIGYVFQEGRLFPHLTVRRNLYYGYRRAPAAERVIGLDQVVDLLGLEHLLDRQPKDLSGGEKQRVALGRALLANPRLLLMDEPLAALDQPRKDEILPFIERLQGELALPIIYVSHAMQEIIRLAQVMVLISDGRVHAVGSVPELTSRLDLRPLTGRYEAGAVVDAVVAGHAPEVGLSQLDFAGGRVQVPLVDLAVGQSLRLRIRARDVSLALAPVRDVSILNQIPCVVADLAVDEGAPEGPFVDLRLKAESAWLWARITKRSWQDLQIQPGQKVFALIDAVAIDRQSLGRHPPVGKNTSET